MRVSARGGRGLTLNTSHNLPQRRAAAYDDARFRAPPDEVPVGAVALAVFLTLFGCASLVLAWLHFTQRLLGKEQAVRFFSFYELCVGRRRRSCARA